MRKLNTISLFFSSEYSIHSVQIAYRFPGEGIDENTIHIDNYTERDLKKKKLDFDLLLGIFLSDVDEEDMGNFTVFPGSHYLVEEFSNRKGGREYFSENGLNEMISEISSSECFREYQILAKKGDIVIANRSLVHLICAPNKSHLIRKMIWFRVRSSQRGEGEEDFDRTQDVWRGWKFAQDIYMSDSFNYCGHGYRENEDVYHIKTKISKPNLFANSIVLNMKKKSIKTNGFLSKKAQKMMEKEIRDMNLEEIRKYIYEIDYQKLIESWFPIREKKYIYLKFHHIKSLSKTGMIKKWADESNISGYIFMNPEEWGSILYAEGENINLFRERFECLYWNKKPKEIEGPVDLGMGSRMFLVYDQNLMKSMEMFPG